MIEISDEKCVLTSVVCNELKPQLASHDGGFFPYCGGVSCGCGPVQASTTDYVGI